MKDRLTALGRSYRRQLASHVTELRRFRELLTGQCAPNGDVQRLYRVTHNLKGSGTTFGFPEISRTASVLHDALQRFMDMNYALPAPVGLLKGLEGLEKSCSNAIASKEIHRSENTTLPVTTGLLESKTACILAGIPNLAATMAERLITSGWHVRLAKDWKSFNSMGTEAHALIIYSAAMEEDLACIQKLPRKENAPVILISARTDFEARLAAVRAGAKAYFTLDADISTITHAVMRLANDPNVKVLIVDDDEMLAEFYSHTLRQAGLKTMAITHPKDALGVLAEHPIDIALIDFSMPGCNGQELATIIRQHAHHAKLPIVVMSARDDVQPLFADNDGGIEFLVKPFTPEQLITIIQSRTNASAD